MNVIRCGLLWILCGVVLIGTARAQDAPPLALKGYDVVAYFNSGKAQHGNERWRTDFDGARYQFSSPQNKAAFGRDPDRYLPQFGGYCAMGIAKGMKFESDPLAWQIVDGKLYVFSSPLAQDAASNDPEILAQARARWQSMK